MSYTYDVFVSYSSEDFGRVQSIVQIISSAGLKPFFDRKDLALGENWKEFIAHGIRQSRFFMPILSKNSVSKQSFIRKEFDYAAAILKEQRYRDVPYILPVALEECNVPEFFSDYQYISLSSGKENDPAIAAMLDRLRAPELRDKSWFLGFDIGHGDSSASYAPLSARYSEYEIEDARFSGSETIPTAVTLADTERNKKTAVGYDALSSGASLIYFKDSNTRRIKETLRLFVTKSFALSPELYSLIDKPKILYFGCPTMWTRNERRIYNDVLRGIIPNTLRTTVISEARAALTFAKFSKQILEFKESSASILVIDIGSSTTDVAYMKDLNSIPYVTGSEILGCSALDYAIFRRTVEKEIDSPRERSRVLSLLKSNPDRVARCLYACRRAKEEYFNRAKGFENDQFGPTFRMPCPGCTRPISVDITKDDMEAVLAMPLPELKNKTWPQTFKQDLDQLRSRIQKETSGIPKLILTVGGGANMGFIYSIIEKTFPKSRIIRLDHPHLAVSRGLTLCALIDSQIEEALGNLRFFFNEKSIRAILEQRLPVLATQLAERVDEISIEAATDKVRAWQDEEYSNLKDLNNRIYSHIRSKITHDNSIKLMLEDWQAKTYGVIEEKVREFCMKYGIESEDIPKITSGQIEGLSLENTITEQLRGGFKNIVGVIAALVVTILAGIGPFGWFIGAILGIASFFVGHVVIEEYFKKHLDNWTMPSWLRGILLDPDSMRDELKNDKESRINELESQILETLKKSLGHRDIVESIEHTVIEGTNMLTNRFLGEEYATLGKEASNA